MKILIVTNHFWPENFRINDLALGLIERGHEVSVLTGVPNYPEGRFYDGYGIFKRRFEVYQGIKISRFPLIPRGRGRSWELALNYLSSAFFSCLCAPFYCRDKYDVIFVFETSPVTIGLPAILLKKLKSIPIVFWVLDLWPDSLSATGAVRSPSILGLVRKVVRLIYRQCDRLLVSSRGFINNIRETGGYHGEITYFPNWVEPDYLEVSSQAELPDLPNGFLIMFAGNIGAAQDFPTILSAAEKLKQYTDIHWVILGDGRMSEWVREQVTIRGLNDTFHLLGRYPAQSMPEFFSKADALLITLKDEPIFALTVPGKLQSYIACGKPIISGINGEGANIIKMARVGLCAPAECPEKLAKNIMSLYNMSVEKRIEMGENGRNYCSQEFDREYLFNKLESIFEDLI